MNTAKTRLSRRQTQILEFITRCLVDRGFPPSIREIGEEVGLSSSSTVQSHLVSIEKKGYIKRNPSKPRSIQLVDHVRQPDRVDQLLALVAGAVPFVERALPTALREVAQAWLKQAAALGVLGVVPSSSLVVDIGGPCAVECAGCEACAP